MSIKMTKFVAVKQKGRMKRFLPLLITLALGQALQAQKMRDVFAAMPDSVLGVMTKNNRLDCIDFIENAMEAKVRNKFDGFSVLKALTVDYLDLQLTSNCRVEMKLLPAEDTLNYICVARTYSGPAAETRVALYTQDWNVLPEEEWISFPAYADFWETDDSVDKEEVARLRHLQDMRFVTASLQPDDMRLTFVLQPGEVDKEEAERMKKVLRPVVYEWLGRRFVRVED